jgi:hypothetical protein
MRSANENELRYFQQGGLLLRMDPASASCPSVDIVTPERLQEEVARLNLALSDKNQAKFLKYFLSLGEYGGLPHLASIRETPYFNRSGELITWDGYNSESRCYLRVALHLLVPVVCANPTRDDVVRAKELIVGEVFGGLPFTCEADLAWAIAAALSPFAPDVVNATAPLIVVKYPLLASLTNLLLTGEDSPPTILADIPRGELRNDLAPLLMRGVPCATIDAVSGCLDRKVVRAVGRSDLGRFFGLSKAMRNVTLLMSNANVSKEVESEILRISLDSNPENSCGENLRARVLSNRGQLVWAALTLIQNWIASGYPDISTNVIVGHEEWASRMGGILMAANIEGAHQLMVARTDELLPGLEEFVTSWSSTYATQDVTVPELISLARLHIKSVVGDQGETSQRTKLGKFLKTCDGCIIADHKIVAVEVADVNSRHRNGWKLEVASLDSPNASTSESNES